MVNSAYFSLVGFDNIQVYSTVRALSGLKLVTLNFSTVENEENAKLWWAGMQNSLVSNCVGLIAILGIAVVYLIVMAIVSSKISDFKTMKKFDILRKHYGTEEVVITLYMITAYGLTINYFLSIVGLIKGEFSDLMGLGLGTILLIFGFVIFMLTIKNKNLLW